MLIFLLTFASISWGRGNPEEYTEAINLGGDDSRYDPMDDKKPRAGQILWIRGLTRLQTQVSDLADNKTFFCFLFKTHFYLISSSNFVLSSIKTYYNSLPCSLNLKQSSKQLLLFVFHLNLLIKNESKDLLSLTIRPSLLFHFQNK